MKIYSNKLKQVTEARAQARTERRLSIRCVLDFWFLFIKEKELGLSAAMSGKENGVIKITNPFPLIKNFFQTWGLTECRSLLREVFRQALSGYSHRESINPADMLYFLEELEMVTEAMWVIGEKKRAQNP